MQLYRFVITVDVYGRDSKIDPERGNLSTCKLFARTHREAVLTALRSFVEQEIAAERITRQDQIAIAREKGAEREHLSGEGAGRFEFHTVWLLPSKAPYAGFVVERCETLEEVTRNAT